MKKLILICLFISMICNTVHSQYIFEELKRYNLPDLDKKVIKKVKKQMKVEKQKKLFTIPVFSVEFIEAFTTKTTTNQEFMNTAYPFRPS